MQRVSATSPLLASIFTFVSAFSLGCVISLGGNGDDAGVKECGSLLANNDENCVCLPGYERCNPGDPEDTDCCEKEGKGEGECEANSYLEDGQCFCNPGYGWCNPDDVNDLTCCEDPGQTSQGTGSGSDTSDDPTGTGTSGSTTEPEPTTSEGTTGEPAECLDAVDPPPTCDPDTELAFCTHPEATCTPEGSTYYSCVDGVWVEDSNALQELCSFDGYDFPYGCVDNPDEGVFIECGHGSGDACQGGTPTCKDANTWQGCKWGKASEVDCFIQCTEIGIDGALFDFGDCQVQDGEAVCACCDEGDEGCEMGA